MAFSIKSKYLLARIMTLSSRRSFLQQSGASVVATASATSLLAPSKAFAFPVDEVGLATDNGLLQLVQSMVALGPRLTGNAAHKTYVDQLATAFADSGLTVMRDPQVFDRWEVKDYSLKVEVAGKLMPVSVAGYHPYSGSTPAEGIKARLVSPGILPAPVLPDPASYTSFDAFAQAMMRQLQGDATRSAVSQPGGVIGAVVLVNIPSLPLFAGIFDLTKSYEYDPDNTLNFTTSYRRTWINGFLAAVADIYKSLGAVGVVYILDVSPEDAKGQYVPFFSKLKQFPGLLVDRVVGSQLRLAASAGAKVQLTLTATVEPGAVSDSLVAILPGMSEENIVINTHTDGQNAFEENGAAACIALAKYYAGKPIQERPRTLVFSCVTGHMVSGLPQAQGLLDAHPDLISRTVASLTIEHFGATEWQDSLMGYRATGNPEASSIFHTGALLKPAMAAVKETDLRRTLLLRPIFGFIFGVGAPFVKAGIPSLAYITGPEYLVAIAPDGHLSKFDKKRMRRELEWCVNVLHKINNMTARDIKG
jgi:hypothetical protein